MNFIFKKKLKFYTKEIFKFLTFTLLAMVIILATISIKYKPIYEVKISGQNVGYINNKDDFQNIITANLQNYQAKNVYDVSIKEQPEYELKLVTKTHQTNESDILIAMQKDLSITYKYFDIYINDEKIDSVDTLEQAESVIHTIQEKDSNIPTHFVECYTDDEQKIETHDLEFAKTNILQKLQLIEKEKKVTINGIKLAIVPVEGTISSRYGVSSRLRKSNHTGLDIAALKNTPIKAVASGTIISAVYSGAYGNLVKIDHGNGVETWYAHTNTMNVKPGQQINAGDIIATVGSTGNSTGPHLHLEIRINGNHVDPQNYLYDI